MNPAIPEVPWQVRPPWPDEMERLPAGLREPLTRRGARRHWLWALAVGELERLVAAATLAERDPGTAGASPRGRIDFVVLPAWNTAPAAVAALLDAALAQAVTLGLGSLEGQATLDTPAAAWFAAQGFGSRLIHEIWRVPLEANFARRHAAVERALGRRPVALCPLDEDALPAVRALCAAHGLLPARRVVLAREGQDGLDPRLSFFTGPAAAPTAVLLARFPRGQAHLEVLARAPGAGSQGPEVGAVLHAFFRAALTLGAHETICTLHAGHAPDTARLLARAEAQHLESQVLFVREPTA